MKVKETFGITPNTSVMTILGSAGYTLETAIADIIDNSIYAQAHNIYIDFEHNGSQIDIKIIDDGKGMSLEKLKNACVVGYDFEEKRDSKDLGRFSTGLKSASRAVASQLVIQSIFNECNTVFIDFENMNKYGWTGNLIENDKKYIPTSTGTAVIWRNIKENILSKDENLLYEKIDNVKNHLNHTFNDYIKNGLNIYINHLHKLEGWDPFCLQMGTRITEEANKNYFNGTISIKTYILPLYNTLNQDEQNYMKGKGLSDQQGFYIYRNKRLIYEGGWLGFANLNISNKFDYARIRVDIPSELDSVFSTNYMKDKISIPEDLKNFFIDIAKKARTNSLKNYNYMKSPTTYKLARKDKIHVWNVKFTPKGLLLNINERHPIIQEICKKLTEGERKKLFDLISKNIPLSEIERSGLSSKQNEFGNLEEFMEDMYKELKDNGYTNEDLCKKMAKCEPFCLNEENLSILLDFLNKKGVL